MSGDDPDGRARQDARVRNDDYRQARIGAAAALTIAVLLIVLFDALSADYEASPIVVGALLGTIAALVGVEIRAKP